MATLLKESHEHDKHLDTVVVNLTDPDVTYSLLADDKATDAVSSATGPVSWVTSFPDYLNYHFYSTMFGNCMCPAFGGYFYNPARSYIKVNEAITCVLIPYLPLVLKADCNKWAPIISF